MEHLELLHRANVAIDALFGDQSVPAETTLDSLKELRDELDVKIDALEQQLS